MKKIGFGLVILGAIASIYSLFIMDVSVAVQYPNGNSFGLPDRVNNFSLMAERQNYIIGSCIAIIIGISLIFYDALVNKKIEKNEDNIPKKIVNPQIWTGKEIFKTILIILFSSIVIGFILIKILQYNS